MERKKNKERRGKKEGMVLEQVRDELNCPSQHLVDEQDKNKEVS
jgi:hypothetical protein